MLPFLKSVWRGCHNLPVNTLPCEAQGVRRFSLESNPNKFLLLPTPEKKKKIQALPVESDYVSSSPGASTYSLMGLVFLICEVGRVRVMPYGCGSSQRHNMCKTYCCKTQNAVEMWLPVSLSKCCQVAEAIYTGAGRSKLGPPTQSQQKQRMGQAGQDWETFITSCGLQSMLRGSPLRAP